MVEQAENVDLLAEAVILSSCLRLKNQKPRA